ncbi:uncharacterized mitochondrial protein AtMg00810-like [Lolium perenne]|uniref:uncharacterized mitochondrial protein AtMg00810-like n=1 Tax=Lolium perenne TaxID=4522 RepID=UPI0021F53443|nr:uncharacterized mitochondrial protein AtMg00810-like [Lolium perenne]
MQFYRNRSVRMQSLRVRRIRSARPFCWDVYGQITERLRAEFALKDLGTLHYFLGIEVVRRTDGFFLHQRKYAHELLDRAGMLNCKPAATPVDTKSKLSATDGSLAMDASFYRSIVGALQYLTLTRPELQWPLDTFEYFMCPPPNNLRIS